MKFLGTGLVILLAAVVLVGCGGDGDGYETKTVEGITLSWKTNDAQDSLLVKLSATTVGMVLIGFDIDPLSGLQDANIITGYVVGDTAYIQDNIGTGEEAYLPDTVFGGTDDVADKAGTENGGTEITFTIPLNSGDPQDVVLEVGNAYLVFLAWGTNDSHVYSPEVYASTEIEL
ncbi:MAG: DOMON domain-containing protein [candidate division WOR-3 bacterium]|nr:DOMON domain-containing protein [candidate division WOR-3 bacterium]